MDNDNDISTPISLTALCFAILLIVLGMWKAIDLTAAFIKWLLP